MTARTHHLRYVALCGCLLLALVVIAWTEVEAGDLLWKSLAVCPFTFAGTFLFNRFQRSREGGPQRAKTSEVVPTEFEARVSNTAYLVTLILGLVCVAVATLAQSYLPDAVWVIPVLAGAAGIHLEAVT